MVTARSLGLPTPRQLYEPLTLSLGLLADFQPGRRVHQERAFFPTLERFGIKGRKRKQYENADLLYPGDGDAHRPTLWRKYIHSFRYMKDSCVRGESSHRVYQESREWYQLTPFGTSVALDLAQKAGIDNLHKYASDPSQPLINLTKLWFKKHWPGDVKERVMKHLSKRLQSSKTQGLIEDHVDHFIERAIGCDSFRKQLAKGEKIYTGTLCTFITRSAYSEMRTWGSDPSCASIRGAVNECERKRIEKFHKEHPNYRAERVFSINAARDYRGMDSVQYEDSNDTWLGALNDCYGGNLEDYMVEAISMKETMDKIAAKFDRRDGEGISHHDVFMMKEIEGMTTQEITDKTGLTSSKVISMVKRARSFAQQESG